MYSPIPIDAGQTAGWQTMSIIENDEPLVEVGVGDYAALGVRPEYAVREIPSASRSIYVRQGVADRLLRAQAGLPPSMQLVVLDGYRPINVQDALYQHYNNLLTDSSDMPLDSYVSPPSTNPSKPSPHLTGGAVDVLIAEDSIDLDFGTLHDDMSPYSHLAYYEISRTTNSVKDEYARHNRRLLCHVMTQAGFQPYDAEWWHFNAPETQMGAVTAGLQTAQYGPVLAV